MERKARSLEESSTGLSGRSVVGGVEVAVALLSPPPAPPLLSALLSPTKASSLGIFESAETLDMSREVEVKVVGKDV